VKSLPFFWKHYIYIVMNDDKFNLKHNAERKRNEFFIDRDGKVIRCKGSLKGDIISMHSYIARQCFPDLDSDALDYIMNKLGWVMVGSTVYNCSVVHKKCSDKQIKKLKELNLYERLIFPYKGDNPKLKNLMPNYSKYEILCDD